jgi:hypothetical protein
MSETFAKFLGLFEKPPRELDHALSDVRRWLRRDARMSEPLGSKEQVIAACSKDSFTEAKACLALLHHEWDAAARSLFHSMGTLTGERELDGLKQFDGNARLFIHCLFYLFDLTCYAKKRFKVVLWNESWRQPDLISEMDRRPFQSFQKLLGADEIAEVIGKLSFKANNRRGFVLTSVRKVMYRYGWIKAYEGRKHGELLIVSEKLVHAVKKVLKVYYPLLHSIFVGVSVEERRQLAHLLWTLRGSKKWEHPNALLSEKEETFVRGIGYAWPIPPRVKGCQMKELGLTSGWLYEIQSELKMARVLASDEEALLLSILLTSSHEQLKCGQVQDEWKEFSETLHKIGIRTRKLRGVLGLLAQPELVQIWKALTKVQKRCENHSELDERPQRKKKRGRFSSRTRSRSARK